MKTNDRRVLLVVMAGLMGIAAWWFGSPWPLVGLAGMLFALILADAWAEHDRASAAPPAEQTGRQHAETVVMPAPWRPSGRESL